MIRVHPCHAAAGALGLLALTLAACGQGEPQKAPPPPAPIAAPPAAPPAEAAPAAGATAALPEGEGREIVQRLCSGCHSLTLVTAKGRTPEEWDATVARMETNGMVAPADDVYAVIDYLSKALPPK